MPLIFQPGEAFQFDWSEDWALLGRRQTKLQVAHTKLDTSNYPHIAARQGRDVVSRDLKATAVIISDAEGDAGSDFGARGGAFRHLRHLAGAVRPCCQTKRVKL